MNKSADPDQLAWSQLIWICTVCKVRVYPGSAGPGLKQSKQKENRKQSVRVTDTEVMLKKHVKLLFAIR